MKQRVVWVGEPDWVTNSLWAELYYQVLSNKRKNITSQVRKHDQAEVCYGNDYLVIICAESSCQVVDALVGARHDLALSTMCPHPLYSYIVYSIYSI